MQGSDSNSKAAGHSIAGTTQNPGPSTNAHSERPVNPFALPPSKKRRAANDEVVGTTAAMPGEARTAHPPATIQPPTLPVPDRKRRKPVVRFNDNLQVQHVVPSTRIRPASAFPAACMTATAGKFLPKWPRPEEEDPISDVEDDLQVMDTPTSSQQDWGMDEEMADADDEVEIIDSSIPMERISSTGPSSRDESPDIPIDRLSVAGTEGQIPASPAANDWHQTNTSSNRPNPHPAVSLPLEYQDDLHERYEPGSPSNIREQINSKRRGMYAEIQTMMRDTEQARRQVVQEDSTWSMSRDSAAAFHLGNTANIMEREIHKNSVMLQELLELDRLLEHASDHAFSVLRRIKGQDSRSVPEDE